MRFIVALLLSCVSLIGATTYPVITDNANRQFTGGATNLALLNGTNTFTGTNNFTGTVLITNAASTISGNGAGLTNISIPNNNIGLRLLWSSPTNIYLSSIAVSAGLDFTNAGDFSKCTYVGKATIPALIGSNSALVISGAVLRTNSSASSAAITFYIGSNTNYVGYANAFSAGSVGNSYMVVNPILQNANSLTNQINGPNWILPSANAGVSMFADFRASNEIYIGAMTQTGHTNLLIYGLKVYELYAP